MYKFSTINPDKAIIRQNIFYLFFFLLLIIAQQDNKLINESAMRVQQRGKSNNKSLIIQVMNRLI